MRNNKRKSKTSWVWEYFDSGNKQVSCKICNSYVKWNNDGTSQLKAHLNTKHNIFKVGCHLNSNNGINQNELQDLNTESEGDSDEANKVKKHPKINEKLVDFVVGCSLPNSIVNNLYFRNLIKALVPEYEYKLPSRGFFSNTLIPEKVNNLNSLNLKEILILFG